MSSVATYASHFPGAISTRGPSVNRISQELIVKFNENKKNEDKKTAPIRRVSNEQLRQEMEMSSSDDEDQASQPPVRSVKRAAPAKRMMRMTDSDTSSDSEDSDDEEVPARKSAPVQPVRRPAPMKKMPMMDERPTRDSASSASGSDDEGEAPARVSEVPVAVASMDQTLPLDAKEPKEPAKKRATKKPSAPRKPRAPKPPAPKKPAAPRKPRGRYSKASFDPLPTAASTSSAISFDPRMHAIAPVRRRGSEATLKRSAADGMAAMGLAKRQNMGN